MMNNHTMTLPKNFAPVTDDEMMYLDGGATCTGSYIEGYTTIYSAKECKKIAADLGRGVVMAVAIGQFLPVSVREKAIAGFVGVLVGSAINMFLKGSKGNGLKRFYQSIPFSGNIFTTTYL